MSKLCCGDRLPATEEERRQAAATGRPPPQSDSGSSWSFSAGNSLLSGLHSHLFGDDSGSCLGQREPAPEKVVQKASETGRPPPAPIQAPPFPTPTGVSSDDLAGRSQPSNFQQPTQVCPACGETCEQRHKFCPFCGSPIATQSKAQIGTPLKARPRLGHQNVADDDLAGLLPSDEEDFARPEASAVVPEAPASRARAPKLHSVSSKQAGDDEASDVSSTLDNDVLADYYRLRGIDPSRRTAAKATATVTPQIEERTAPFASGQQVSRGSATPPPLASPHGSERSARTAEFGAGGYSREHADSRMPSAPSQDVRKPAHRLEPSLSEPIASSSPQAEAKKAQPVQWSWPIWALDRQQPCIEVYVEDEDTGEGRWIKQCTPLHRVVHPDGHDQFLAAEYIWDDESYEQDFEPQHVRPFWSKQTVLDMARDGTLESIRRP